MLLTITTTHAPATDMGFLLEKHPDKVHEFELSSGRATVFYPEATPERCTVALLLEVDSIGLVRSGAARQGDPSMDQWCTRQAGRFGYSVEYAPIGDEHALTGPPTQLALFSRTAQ